MSALSGAKGVLKGRWHGARISPLQLHRCPTCCRSWSKLEYGGCRLVRAKLKIPAGICGKPSKYYSRQIQCMSSGSGFDGDPDKEPKWYSDWLIPLAVAASGAGLAGTSAVALGYLLHVDPFGHFHFSVPDQMVGMACFVPSYFFYLGVYISLKNRKTKPQTHLKIDASGARHLVSELGEDVKVEEEPQGPLSKLSSQWDLLQSGVQLYAFSKSMKGSKYSLSFFSPPLYIFVIFISVLSQEMLLRGVGLTWLSMWYSDRLAEAGMENICYVSGCSVNSISMWLTFFTMSFSTFLVMSGLNYTPKENRLKVHNTLYEKLENPGTGKDGTIDREKIAKKVDMLFDTSVVIRSLNVLEVMLDGTASSAAFILTGNLWAAVLPYTISSVLGAKTVMLGNPAPERIIAKHAPGKLQEARTNLLDIKLKLLRMLVKKYLGEDSTFPNRDLEASHRQGGLESISKDPEESNDVDVSLTGKVLVTMLREEIVSFNDMIRRERTARESIKAARDLEEARNEVQGLLSKVEKHLEENPESDIDHFPGKVTVKARSKARKEDNDQPAGE